MKRHCSLNLLIVFTLSLASCRSVPAQQLTLKADGAVDTLVLGDEASEKQHQLSADLSDVVKEGLGEPARRLLPKNPPSYEGGAMTFTLAVDPNKQNYLTAKFWGSDKGEERGRLILFHGGDQIGYRSEGDYDVLNHCDIEGQAPGRFVYQTAIIPTVLTKGKTSVTLTIRSFGPVWWYGPNFEKFQKNLASPTRGIYRLYTHTATRFDPPANEAQGQFESKGIRPAPGEEVIDKSRKIVIDRLKKLLDKPQQNPGIEGLKNRNDRLGLLCEAYHVAWTPACKNPAAIAQMLRDGDDSVRAAAADPKVIEGGWLGLGPVGNALVRTGPDLLQTMDEKIDLGVAGASTRREAWATVLRKSVDYWRMNRRGYTNQSMIVDENIYAANRGIQILKPELALPEAQAKRYIYEAVGLEPWRGSDVPESERLKPTTRPDSNEWTWVFGEHHYDITRKGLSREVGWVGTYGETILTFLREIVELTDGDPKIREQLRKVQKARFFFRYPGLDADGYQCMKLTSEIDNRTAHYPKAGADYLAAEIGESWWMEVPAMLPDDPAIVGVAQQALADNQYFRYVESRLSGPNTLGMMRNVNEYVKVKSLSASAYRLPGTTGQPDFAFADEQDAVVAIKHGQTQLFVNLYYRSFFGINGVARVLEVNPTITRLASVKSEYTIESPIGMFVRPDYIHSQYAESRGHLPPGETAHQVLRGEEMPIAAPPAGVVPLKAPAWGPYAGKAQFYQLRYGDYLIAVNTTTSKIFHVYVPADAPDNARELVSGQSVKAGQRLEVGSLSTVVIYARP